MTGEKTPAVKFPFTYLLPYTSNICQMIHIHISDRRNDSETLQNETVLMAAETHHLVRNNILIEEESS